MPLRLAVACTKYSLSHSAILGSPTTMSSLREKTSALLVGTSVAAVVVLVLLKRRKKEEPLPIQVELACNCGQARFQVKSTHALPLMCYCDDCQGYVKWVTDKKKTNKNAQTVMAEDGGCRVCQVFKAEITEARENSSAKVQWTVLDPKHAPPHPQTMFRGHATCCHTPMFSACWREIPTVGLLCQQCNRT